MLIKLSELKNVIKSTIARELMERDEFAPPMKPKKAARPMGPGDPDVQPPAGMGMMGGGMGEEEEPEDSMSSGEMEEGGVESLEDVPETLTQLRTWLWQFVAPKVPLSQIPSFHRFVKKFLEKAEELELKPKEDIFKKRLDFDDEEKEGKKKEKKSSKKEEPKPKKSSEKPEEKKKEKSGGKGLVDLGGGAKKASSKEKGEKKDKEETKKKK